MTPRIDRIMAVVALLLEEQEVEADRGESVLTIEIKRNAGGYPFQSRLWKTPFWRDVGDRREVGDGMRAKV